MREWFENFLGPELAGIASAITALLFALVLLLFLFFLYRQIVGPRIHGNMKSRAKRLQVMDASPVDAKRRLVLVRRDDIEHLILIGGPNDLLIEPRIVRGQNISRPRPQNMQGQNIPMTRTAVPPPAQVSNNPMQGKPAPSPQQQHTTAMPKTTQTEQNAMARAAALAASAATLAQNVKDPLSKADVSVDKVEINDQPTAPINVDTTLSPPIESASEPTQPTPSMPEPVTPEIPNRETPISHENPPVPQVVAPETNADETDIDLADFEQNLTENLALQENTTSNTTASNNDDVGKTLEDEMEQLLGELSGEQSSEKSNR